MKPTTTPSIVVSKFAEAVEREQSASGRLLAFLVFMKIGLNNHLDMIKSIILNGIYSGEFKEDMNADALASFAFSLLEGGILLSKLDGDNKHMQMNTACFAYYLQNCCLKNS